MVSAAGLSPEDPAFADEVGKQIYRVVSSMQELVHGFDFARLLDRYYTASITGDDDTKACIAKWFRGEYNTKTEARNELGISIIISDDDWYEYLKLFAWFLKKAGYSGLLVMVDELVNIYKIPNSITRQYNYEKILTMYNDAMQGRAQYLGVIMSGTPQCIEDVRRGVYSYEALRSRLQEGKFSGPKLRNLLSPVIRLNPLTAEEMLVLSAKLSDIHALLYGYENVLTDEDLSIFIQIEYGRIGADENITPREVIRDFIELLDILYQNPGTDVRTLLSSEEFTFSQGGIEDDSPFPAAEYAEFKI